MHVRTVVAAAVVVLVLTGCGSDPSASENGAGDEAAASSSDRTVDSSDRSGSATVIGSGNVGGEVVDPTPHPIDDIAIMESSTEQLAVTFTASDPNCTAANATATTAAGEIVVALEVGLTDDALSRSCVAGTDYEQTVVIALTEGIDGRTVVAGS